MSDSEPTPDLTAALVEESAEDLYENAPCGYLSALPGGLIARVNRTFLTWTGYSREELVGRRRFQDLLTAGGRIYHETHYAPLLLMQGAVREIAVEIVCADGRRLPALINSVLQRDEAGNPLSVRTTVFDATDRKEYERELLRARQRAERATQVKADFLSMVSHEIRTPLGAIMTAVHLLEATELSPQQEKIARILHSSSESLLDLISELLDLSKLEAGKVVLERERFDPRRLVEETAELFRLKAEEKGLDFEVLVDERVPAALLGDATKIRQMLANLLSNAIKFTHEGSVTLAVEALELDAGEAALELRVADTGIGIEPDRLPHIFDEFTQASDQIGRLYGGTGLGLAITEKLLALHGSRMKVTSTPGEGSTFSFVLRLPVVSVDPAAEERASG